MKLRCILALYKNHLSVSKPLILFQTPYSFDSESREPDAFVISLNDDLVACQEVLAVYLGQSKIRFLLASLSYLMGAVLISSLTKIKVWQIVYKSNNIS